MVSPAPQPVRIAELTSGTPWNWSITGTCIAADPLNFRGAHSKPFILSDDGGATSIRVVAFRQAATSVHNLIHLNSKYTISGALVVPTNRSYYNPATSDFEIQINHPHVIRNAPRTPPSSPLTTSPSSSHAAPEAPQSPPSPRPPLPSWPVTAFAKLSNLRTMPEFSTVSVVAVVEEVRPLVPFTPRNGGPPSVQRSVRIVDDTSMQPVTVSLLHDTARTKLTEVDTPRHPVVVIRRAMKRSVNDLVSLFLGTSTSYSVEPDPESDLPEAKRLRRWYDSGHASPAHASVRSPLPAPTSLPTREAGIAGGDVDIPSAPLHQLSVPQDQDLPNARTDQLNALSHLPNAPPDQPSAAAGSRNAATDAVTAPNADLPGVGEQPQPTVMEPMPSIGAAADGVPQRAASDFVLGREISPPNLERQHSSPTPRGGTTETAGTSNAHVRNDLVQLVDDVGGAHATHVDDVHAANAAQGQVPLRSPPVVERRDPSNRAISRELVEQYSVFICHAGTEKDEFASPLYYALKQDRARPFLDKNELRPSPNTLTESVMRAIDGAKIAVFILSPDFFKRKWPVLELGRFIARRSQALSEGREPPVLIPVFYKWSIKDCKNPHPYTCNGSSSCREYSGIENKDEVAMYMRELPTFIGIEPDTDPSDSASSVWGLLGSQLRRFFSRVQSESADPGRPLKSLIEKTRRAVLENLGLSGSSRSHSQSTGTEEPLSDS